MERNADTSFDEKADFAGLIGRLRESLIVAGGARDELPPVTSYRAGLVGRAERWLKFRLKKATHWFTWGQVNFNTATCQALEQVASVLIAQQEEIARLAAAVAAADERKKRFAILLAEQQACLRQLSLEVSETAVVTDRARRKLEHQLNQLAADLAELRKELDAGASVTSVSQPL